jgi:heme oxygenase
VAEVPAFYRFSERVTGGTDGSSRRDFIEEVYEKLNEVGAAMPEATHTAVVHEAKLAFRHNAAVYTERAERVPSMWVGAALGVARIATGAVWVR